MRVIHSIQVQRNFISYLEDKEPFAVAHDNKVAGCYFPTGTEVEIVGRNAFFDDHGLYYRVYPELKEDDLVKILEDMRDKVFE